jgi:ABC-type Zn uptake system ZnuABC Zn-binding protein ZnuA
MPPGADPHGFQPSASDAAMLREADLVVANGLMLEENLVSALEAAEEDGVRVFELADKLDPIDFDWDGPRATATATTARPRGRRHGHDDARRRRRSLDEDDHGTVTMGTTMTATDDGHDDGHGARTRTARSRTTTTTTVTTTRTTTTATTTTDDDHDHGPEDPHIWFDPVRMADGVRLLAAELADVDDHLDADEWESAARPTPTSCSPSTRRSSSLRRIPDENRQLVTNHDALGYLANRYGFEVLGTVIPGSSTQAEADARQFAELIRTVEEAQVPAVFAENTDSTTLAEQLASEVDRTRRPRDRGGPALHRRARRAGQRRRDLPRPAADHAQRIADALADAVRLAGGGTPPARCAPLTVAIRGAARARARHRTRSGSPSCARPGAGC